MNNTVLGVFALVFGILVLVIPEMLQWLVGILLIGYGILVLLGHRVRL